MTSSIPDTVQFHTLPVAQYVDLLEEKTHRLKTLLTPFLNEHTSDMQVYSSAVSNFRMRAEFGVWHEADDCFYTMAEKDSAGKSTKVKVTHFPIASQAINQLMPELLSELKAHEDLKQKLFQVEFLSTLSGDMLVSLIYHKKLEQNWLEQAKRLEQIFDIFVIGRSRKQKEVISQDFVTESLQVFDKTYKYKQLEGGFTQPNAHVCEHMLTWACEQARQIKDNKDLLELYCGNANFTLPLSQFFRNVLATEISKTSVAAAQWNIQENDLNNIKIARLSAEEFTEAQAGTREFRRLKQAGIFLKEYDFSTVFVDPPRAGIDDETLKLLARFQHIIYISCNPDTLAANLEQLTKTHVVNSTALFDQFPYTHHIEAGVWLTKKD